MRMKDQTRPLIFIFIIIVTATVCTLAGRKQIILVEMAKTWQEARNICRSNYTDLATFRSEEEMDWTLYHLLNFNEGHFWFGLHRDAKDPSAWRRTELVENPLLSTSDPTHWASHLEPEGRNCTMVTLGNMLWHSWTCSVNLFFLCSDGGTIHLVKSSLTWWSARHYCEEHHQSLATITAETFTVAGGHDYSVWIGLFRDVDDEWKWAGETQSDLRNWAPGNPDREDCGSLRPNSDQPGSFLWYASGCRSSLFFLCYNEKLVLVRENKTWEEALASCRALVADPESGPAAYQNHRYDLASLLSHDDHMYAWEKAQSATSDEVWTGLRFLAGHWLWVSGDNLQYANLPPHPDVGQHCGTLGKNRVWNRQTRDCSTMRNFLCFQIDFN